MTTVSPTSSGTSGTSGLTSGSASEQSDRFLKLLVTQMQNQDPLNPLDNAEVTSQMAQISTVTGLETLNASVTGLNSQFIQLQAMQAAALVGHDVAFEGDELRIQGETADAGFELSSDAAKVSIKILDAAGNTLDTIEMTEVAAGRHDFTWAVPEDQRDAALHFEISASSGTGDIEVMPLAHQTITAVSNFGDTLAVELANGERIAHNAIWAYL